MWTVTIVGHKPDLKFSETFIVRGNSRRAVSERVRAKAGWFDSAVGGVQPDGTLILRPSKASKGVWVATCRKVPDLSQVFTTQPLYDFATVELVSELITRIKCSNGMDFVSDEVRDELLTLLEESNV